MPGNVAPATADGVLPKGLATALVEVMRLEALANAYADGSSERVALALNPRHFFRLTLAVRPDKWAEFWDFYRAHRGTAFWFYNLRETVPPYFYDPTGSNPVGRYLVVFDSAWTEELRAGNSTISFNLREVV